MKRMLVWVLAVCLLAGLGWTAASAAEPPAGVNKIVLYNNSGAGTGAGMEAGSSQQGYDMVQQYIYEQTGTWVEGILGTGAATEVKTKLQLMLAGGDQVDLWWGNWREYVDSGILQPWTDLLSEYPVIVDAWEAWGAWSGVTDADGVIWGMPRMTPTTPYQIFVRQDWLELLGMAQPATFEELNAYLYAIQELDPYGNGGTVPLGARLVSELRSCFAAGFTGKGSGYWLDEADGQVKPVFLMEGYKDFMNQMHAWYADGIFHRESFSWDTNTLRDYITRGQVAATACWYSSITGREASLVDTLTQAGAIVEFEKYPYLYDISRTGIVGPSGAYIESHTGVQAQSLLMHVGCKDPKAALDFIAWQYEAWENYQTAAAGLKDVHWRYDPDADNAEENHLVTGWKDDQGTAMYMTANGSLSYTNELLYASNFNAGIGLPNEVKSTAFDATTGRQNMHNFWLQNRLNQFETAMKPELDYSTGWDTVILTERVPHNGDLTTYCDEESLKFVTGTRSMDEWDTFLDELYKMGLQDRIDEYTRQYNELAAK